MGRFEHASTVPVLTLKCFRRSLHRYGIGLPLVTTEVRTLPQWPQTPVIDHVGGAAPATPGRSSLRSSRPGVTNSIFLGTIPFLSASINRHPVIAPRRLLNRETCGWPGRPCNMSRSSQEAIPRRGSCVSWWILDDGILTLDRVSLLHYRLGGLPADMGLRGQVVALVVPSFARPDRGPSARSFSGGRHWWSSGLDGRVRLKIPSPHHRSISASAHHRARNSSNLAVTLEPRGSRAPSLSHHGGRPMGTPMTPSAALEPHAAQA